MEYFKNIFNDMLCNYRKRYGFVKRIDSYVFYHFGIAVSLCDFVLKDLQINLVDPL